MASWTTTRSCWNWLPTVERVGEGIAAYPQAFGHLAGVADMLVFGAVQVALVGAPGDGRLRQLVQAVGRRYVPSLVLAGGSPDAAEPVALLRGRGLLDGAPAAYVCRHYACDSPTADPIVLAQLLATS